ncbi:sensor histidine kinase [Xanthomonas sp. NCPPB 2654]|uniref:sensor histidine kinase n=1 Tax=unclassified Xanthomonas TaxID=2643310 RepID=UPI0021E09F71|nr:MULTISPECIES: sensor histidine kinase [unclassified Xanthomonas]MDL5367133.1 sensor histidine kinase [Xanthomonas sp. NCPPB 2654]MEB1529933.1 sensor histidine kinase [Xanthomonas campestris pv. campestris]UYC21072.1 sensor histidine kinase [Xanthomonas sp. CFBP 8443]
MIDLLQASPESLVAQRMSWTTAKRSTQWFVWLSLVWSIWLFITPLYERHIFRDWFWPTMVSYAAFLALYYCAYYRDRRYLRWCVAGMAVLAFVLLPYNPGAQCYMIYACAFLAFCFPIGRALLAMLLLLGAFAAAWMLQGWSLLYMTSAVVVGLSVGLMNISFERRARADAQLRLSHEEVRRLAAVAERERIGRDLHDLLGHTLSLVALKSDLAARLLARDPAAARQEMEDVGQVAREALGQVRRAVSGIRAAQLAAEMASAKLLLESSGVTFRYQVDALPQCAQLETVFAMVLREAATNIQRHAGAGNAQLRLWCERGQAWLEIRDDGRGSAMQPGTGLASMRERLEAVGGSLRIDSERGQGTRLLAAAPLPRTAEPAPGVPVAPPHAGQDAALH